MVDLLRFRVEKLIRDRLPDIMRASGLAVFERTLDTADFIASLKSKLAEESAEAAAADGVEDLLGELADVLEVVAALAEVHGADLAAVEARRQAKRAERGGFEGRIYNAAVEGPADCPAVAYYLAKPDQYPRL